MARARVLVVTLCLVAGLASPALCQQLAAGRGLQRVNPRDKGTIGPLYTGSHALVIGVEAYSGKWKALSGVTGEVGAVAKTLTELDFSVTKVLNPTGAELHAAFRRFVDRHGYEAGHRLFVFFAGHAHVRKGGRSYLVPADAPDPGEEPQAFMRVALAMTQVMAWARTMEARHVLFALDCDVGGAIFGSRSHSPPAAVADGLSRPVRQFIVAGQHGTLKQKRGTYGAALIAGIGGKADLDADGFVTGTELGMYVRKEAQRRGETLALFGKIRDPDLDEGDFCFWVAADAQTTERSQQRAQLEALREQRRQLETEARAMAASQQRHMEWKGLRLALEILEEADRKADKMSSRAVTKESDTLAEILGQAAARALLGGDLVGASALATQAAELSPGRSGAVELFETVCRRVDERRIEIVRSVAMGELKVARGLELPADVRTTFDHIDEVLTRDIPGMGTRHPRITEVLYNKVTWRARGLRAVAAGQGTAVFAEIELLGPLVAGSNGPDFFVHVGNLTTRTFTVDLSGAKRTLRVVLTGPLPQRRTFALPEPLYARKTMGKPQTFRPNEYRKDGAAMLSGSRLPQDFFQSREYPVPPPGMYEMQAQVTFPEREGSWSGTYQSVPRMVRVWTVEERRAIRKAR